MEPNQYPGTPGAEAVQAIAQLARDGQRCSKEVVAGTPVAHFPGTRELASLEQFMQTPLRKRVMAEFMSLESMSGKYVDSRVGQTTAQTGGLRR